MQLVLRSEPSGPNFTLGSLYVDGVYACRTLEDIVREVPGVEVSEWKVKGATAIPAGVYKVTLENSPRFGPETLTVHNVPGFSHIRMHAGNTQNDTEGCPLLGMQAGPHGIVGGTSKPAVLLVRNLVRAALARGEPVSLTVERSV